MGIEKAVTTRATCRTIFFAKTWEWLEYKAWEPLRTLWELGTITSSARQNGRVFCKILDVPARLFQ